MLNKLKLPVTMSISKDNLHQSSMQDPSSVNGSLSNEGIILLN